jgi:polar amino acid transport system permease protein
MAFRFTLAGGILIGSLALIFLGLGSNYSLEFDKAFQFLSWYNDGLIVTLELFIGSAILAISLGLIVALMRLSPWGPVRDLGGLYVHAFRNLPALVVLLLFIFALSPILEQVLRDFFESTLNQWFGWEIDFRFKMEIFGREYGRVFLWSMIAFGVYESSYLGEIFRAGIQSVHKTQIEAAQSLGMNYFQRMFYVVFPQALRVILPPLTGTLVALVKETALIYLVSGVGDLTDKTRQLAIPRRPYIFEFYTILAMYYLAIVIPMSILSQWLESRLGISKARRGGL